MKETSTLGDLAMFALMTLWAAIFLAYVWLCRRLMG
jgi:hypothetical protein